MLKRSGIRGVVRQRDTWATPARKVAALCRTAFNARVQSQEHFSSTDFIKWNSDINVDETLLAICQRDTGAIVESYERGRWHFAHRVFSDYLAARYVVDHTGDSSAAIEPFFKSGDWVDVWAYSCGIAQDATSLILLVVSNDTISKNSKIDGLSKAFEQDIIISNNTISLVATFFQGEIDRLILSKKVKISKPYEGKALLIRSPQKSLTHEIVNLFNSIRRLRKTKLGLEINEWLLKSKQRKAQYISILLTADELVAISVDQNAEVQVMLLDHLKALDQKSRDF